MSHLPSMLDADDCVSAAEVKARVRPVKRGAAMGPDGHPSDYRCDECGDVFFANNEGQRFCGTACAIEGWRREREAGR